MAELQAQSVKLEGKRFSMSIAAMVYLGKFEYNPYEEFFEHMLILLG